MQRRLCRWGSVLAADPVDPGSWRGIGDLAVSRWYFIAFLTLCCLSTPNSHASSGQCSLGKWDAGFQLGTRGGVLRLVLGRHTELLQLRGGSGVVDEGHRMSLDHLMALHDDKEHSSVFDESACEGDPDDPDYGTTEWVKRQTDIRAKNQASIPDSKWVPKTTGRYAGLPDEGTEISWRLADWHLGLQTEKEAKKKNKKLGNRCVSPFLYSSAHACCGPVLQCTATKKCVVFCYNVFTFDHPPKLYQFMVHCQRNTQCDRFF